MASRMQRVWPGATTSPTSTNGGDPGCGSAVEGADHRRLDAHERAADGAGGRHVRLGHREGRLIGRGRADREIRRRADRDPHAVLLDRHLADARLLHDADDLADPLGARRRPSPQLASSRRPRPRIPRSSRSASSPKRPSRSSSSSLAAMPAGAARAPRRSGGATSSSLSGSCVSWTTRSSAGSIGAGGVPKRAGDEARTSSTIDEVAARREDVDDRLRGEHLADRRRERRPAGLRADPVELLEHLVEPVAGAFRRAATWSIPATTLAGRSCRAASTAMRGTSGVTSSSPMCSSTRSVASQSASTSTPGSSPMPPSASASASPETRCSVSASG